MKLFFDTETSGRADFAAPPDAPQQPHLMSLAAVCTDDDYNEIISCNLIVKPHEKFKIEPGALDAHGITWERADEVGVPMLTVLSLFYTMAKVSSYHIAYNYEFDKLIIQAALARVMRPSGLSFPDQFAPEKALCEMNAMTDHCKIPKSFGRRGKGQQYKWPSLKEAYSKATDGGSFANAHDAMADTRAMVTVHKWRMAVEAEGVSP